MTDRVGTVRARKLPAGVGFHYAIRQREGWLTLTASNICRGEFHPDYEPEPTWNGEGILTWPVIHTPPYPVGTVLRRQRGDEWEVAVRTSQGWVHVHYNDTTADRWATEPDEIDDAPWEVLHGPGD